MKKSMVPLLVCLLACFAVAWFGSQFVPGEWYQSLGKPSWTPPNAIFPPVWTALYLLMAVSAWLIWTQRGFRSARPALALFGVQLVFNGLWSWIFFGMHRIGLAFVDISLLWLALIAVILAFARRRPLAAWLLIPYLIWISYASALNLAIWQLNP